MNVSIHSMQSPARLQASHVDHTHFTQRSCATTTANIWLLVANQRVVYDLFLFSQINSYNVEDIFKPPGWNILGHMGWIFTHGTNLRSAPAKSWRGSPTIYKQLGLPVIRLSWLAWQTASTNRGPYNNRFWEQSTCRVDSAATRCRCCNDSISIVGREFYHFVSSVSRDSNRSNIKQTLNCRAVTEGCAATQTLL